MAGRVQNWFINSHLNPCLSVWLWTVSQLGKGDLCRFRMKKPVSSLRNLQMPPHIKSYGGVAYWLLRVTTRGNDFLDRLGDDSKMQRAHRRKAHSSLLAVASLRGETHFQRRWAQSMCLAAGFTPIDDNRDFQQRDQPPPTPTHTQRRSISTVRAWRDSAVFSGTLGWSHCLHLQPHSAAPWRKPWLHAQGHTWLPSVLVSLFQCAQAQILGCHAFFLRILSPLSPPVLSSPCLQFQVGNCPGDVSPLLQRWPVKRPMIPVSKLTLHRVLWAICHLSTWVPRFPLSWYLALLMSILPLFFHLCSWTTFSLFFLYFYLN